MKLRNTILILILFLLVACNQVKKDIDLNDSLEFNSKEKILNSPDTAFKNQYEELSFVKENGSFLRYECIMDSLFLSYGNRNFEKLLEDTYVCLKPNVGIPMIWEVDDERLLLHYGCGNPCWGLIELPLLEHESIQKYKYPYKYNRLNDILIHLGYSTLVDKYVLMARNLDTKEFQVIPIEECGAAFIGNCIDSISFNNKTLYVQYKSHDELENRKQGSLMISQKITI